MMNYPLNGFPIRLKALHKIVSVHIFIKMVYGKDNKLICLYFLNNTTPYKYLCLSGGRLAWSGVGLLIPCSEELVGSNPTHRAYLGGSSKNVIRFDTRYLSLDKQQGKRRKKEMMNKI